MKKKLTQSHRKALGIALGLLEILLWICYIALVVSLPDLYEPFDEETQKALAFIIYPILLFLFGAMFLSFIMAMRFFFSVEFIKAEAQYKQDDDAKSIRYQGYKEILKIWAVRERQKEKQRQIKNEKQSMSETLSTTTIETMYDMLINTEIEISKDMPMHREFFDKILSQLNTSRPLIADIHLVIDKQFERNSITYLKYDSTVSAAEKALTENIAQVLRKMRFFNESSFHQITDAIKDDSYHEDEIPDDLQENSVKGFQDDIEYINSMLAKNDEVILELEKLDKELKTYTGSSE